MNCSENILFNVNKPYQYTGDEVLSVKKNFGEAQIRFALGFPDEYGIGISNLGLKVLYHVINSRPEFLADRVYAPETDFITELQKSQMLLCGLETGKPLKDFDFIGFSLQYELAYPTVLKMLELGGISVKRTERGENEPIIVAGGPCCYNPAPMSDFIDIFLIGDGEDIILEICDCLKNCKNLSRKEKLEKLSQIEGVYSSEHKNKVKKRVAKLDYETIPIKSPVPYSTCVHDRSIIEIRRGCGRMCRFCQPGHVNLPIRERPAEDIIKAVKSSLKETGYDEYSLLSLSSNDYTNIIPVIKELTFELCEKKISVSLPSQRIDRYSEELAKLVRGIRKSAVTLAPEAGSQRLRNVINKNLSEEQILETVLHCYKSGADSVKLYFIIGLPTENDEDIRETAELLRKIRYRSVGLKNELGLKNPLHLTCTVSIFVPKPFTPFQRCGQNSAKEIKEKISLLLDLTSKIKNVKINYHNPFVSSLEAAFTRGGENFSNLVYSLYKKGAYLTSDDKNIDYELWKNVAKECGIDFEEEATKNYSKEEKLPWDCIDIGINKEWFDKEFEKALNAQTTFPCEFNCVNCGVCKNFGVHPSRDKIYEPKIPETVSKTDNEKYKYVIQLTKENSLKYLSHLDWQNTLIKSLFRSGLKMCFSQGFNPTPKISFAPALPLFVESLTEFIEIELAENYDENFVKKALTEALPKNSKVVKVCKISENIPAFDRLLQWAEYEFIPTKNLYDCDDLLYTVNEIFLSRENIFTEKKNKKGITKTIDIKPAIHRAGIKNGHLSLILKTGQNDEIPALRADLAINLLLPEIKFNIVRTKFFDENFNEITPEGLKK